jgi:SAM-dependent methyltransferase
MAYTRVGDLLLGLVALALLRGRLQDLGGETFSDARVADLRRILDNWSEPALQSAASWHEAPASDGYATWAATYDDGGNPLIELDQVTLGPLLERYPTGDALDAACGTGRWAAFLSERGHTMIGVDESPQMLRCASAKVPRADFRLGDIQALPVATASVDVVVCSLALTHLAKLDGVLAEFERVLRPGGHAVISNIHHLSLPLGGTIEMVLTDGRPVRLPATAFLPSDYINGALKAGFQIQACAEVPWRDHGGQHGGPTAQAWCAEAARLAYTGTPALLVVELVKPPVHQEL